MEHKYWEFLVLFYSFDNCWWRCFLEHEGNWSGLVCLPQTQRPAGVTPHPPPRSAQGERWPRPCPWVPRRPGAGALWWESCAWLTVAWWRYWRTRLWKWGLLKWADSLASAVPFCRWFQIIQVSWWRQTVPTSSALCCPHTGGATRLCPLLSRSVTLPINMSENINWKRAFGHNYCGFKMLNYWTAEIRMLKILLHTAVNWFGKVCCTVFPQEKKKRKE